MKCKRYWSVLTLLFRPFKYQKALTMRRRLYHAVEFLLTSITNISRMAVNNYTMYVFGLSRQSYLILLITKSNLPGKF